MNHVFSFLLIDPYAEKITAQSHTLDAGLSGDAAGSAAMDIMRKTLGYSHLEPILSHRDPTGIQFWVDDEGFLKPTEEARYWTAHFRPDLLVGKAAVCYVEPPPSGFPAMDREVLSLLGDVEASVRFIGPAQNAEREILTGNIIRPQITVNGKVTWEWRYKPD